MTQKTRTVIDMLLDSDFESVDTLKTLAEAAGYEYCVAGGAVHILGLMGGHDRNNWNPAADDGDALRLAVSTGNTDLSHLVGQLALADNMNGLTGVAVVRRAIVWSVLARYAEKISAATPAVAEHSP